MLILNYWWIDSLHINESIEFEISCCEVENQELDLHTNQKRKVNIKRRYLHEK